MSKVIRVPREVVEQKFDSVHVRHQVLMEVSHMVSLQQLTSAKYDALALTRYQTAVEVYAHFYRELIDDFRQFLDPSKIADFELWEYQFHTAAVEALRASLTPREKESEDV